MLLIRKPWDSQPLQAASVDRSTSLAARLRRFYAPLQFAGSADAGLVVTPYGVAFNTAGSSRIAVGTGRSDGRFTVMAGFIVSDGADPDASGEYIFACRYNGSAEPFVFRLNASRQLYTGSFTGGSVTHASSLTLNSYAVGYALVGAAATSDTWTAGHIVNGVDTSTSGTFTGATRSAFTTNIGSADITGTISRYYSKPILWIAEFDGHLSADERRQVAENPRLFAPRSIWVPVSAGGGGATDLTIQDAAHGHAADSPTLTLGYTDLAIADATHGHTADSPTITVASTLAIQDAAHAHAADSLAITLDTTLAIADATHAHAADNLTISVSGATDLVIQDATHGHSADNATLTLGYVDLAIADALHGHAADNITLGGLYTDLELILKILSNRQELNATTGTFTIYDDDSVSVLYTANAWADAAGTVPYSGGTLGRIDALA